MSGTRSRNLKRQFIFLRKEDKADRVPNASCLRTLEGSGRVKDLEFNNHAATSHIMDLLRNTFSISEADVSRLAFYKTVNNTARLSKVGEVNAMCGDTLKCLFKSRSKVYIQIKRDPGNSAGPGASAASNQDDQVQPGAQQQDQEDNADTTGHITIDDDEDDGDDATPHQSPRRSGSDTDEELWNRPVFSSTPRPRNSAVSVQTQADRFVNTLYDSISVSGIGASVTGGICSRATEVGTIDELEDRLIGAETDQTSGPAYDLQLCVRLMATYDVPNRLPFLCMNAREMRLQSHTDCTPVILIRYQPTQRAANILRTLVRAADFTPKLTKCNIHVALKGSPFDDKACGKHVQSTMAGSHCEIFIMYPTMSNANRMIVGTILTGSETDFLTQVNQAVADAFEAVEAIAKYRDIIEQGKASQSKEQVLEKGEEESEVEGIQGLDSTIEDSEELHRKRIVTLDKESYTSKRPRKEDEDGDDSGTVSFRPT